MGLRNHIDALLAWPKLHPYLIVLIGLVGLAFALRVVDVTDNPRGFFTDEAAAGLDAKAILEGAEDQYGNFMPFFFRSLGDYKLPVFIYAQVPFIALLGLSELAVRLTVVAMGTATVVTTYLLARELFRDGPVERWRIELPALASAALLAILPWHIHYSRTGFGELMSLPLVFTLAWWLFLRAQREGRSLLPAAMGFAVCFYTYRSGWVVLPPFLVLLALAYRVELLQRPRHALVCAGVFLLLLVPLAEHLLFGPGDRASQAWIFNVESEKGTVELFLDQYTSYFTTSFLFDEADNGFLLRHYLPGQGVLYWFMAPLIVAGLVKIIVRQDRRGMLLVALLFLYPLGGALSDTSPISSRTILGSVVFALIAGWGLAAVVELAGALRRSLAPGIAAGVVTAAVLAAAVSLVGYLQHYFDDYPAISAGYWGWQDGPEEIMARFTDMQDEYDELYLEGFFNAPHVFIPFYTDGDCPKCLIGDGGRYEPDKRQLFAFRIESPMLERYEFEVRETLFYPDGAPSFLLVEITGER